MKPKKSVLKILSANSECFRVFAGIAPNKAGYEGFIRKRHEKDSWSKGRNIEYGGEAEADFMPEAEYQEQL